MSVTQMQMMTHAMTTMIDPQPVALPVAAASERVDLRPLAVAVASVARREIAVRHRSALLAVVVVLKDLAALDVVAAAMLTKWSILPTTTPTRPRAIRGADHAATQVLHREARGLKAFVADSAAGVPTSSATATQTIRKPTTTISQPSKKPTRSTRPSPKRFLVHDARSWQGSGAATPHGDMRGVFFVRILS